MTSSRAAEGVVIPFSSSSSAVSGRLAFVSAVNRDDVVAGNLLRSPDLATGAARILQERGHASAGAAYNAAINRSEAASVVAFVHQDVYLPAGWVARVEGAISLLEVRREPWAILGVWGLRENGRMAGRVWCSGGNMEHRAPTEGVTEVSSIDEIVIILNMRHGLRFDAELPAFHLYATDIILQARQKGFKAFVVDAPVIHNSRYNPRPVDLNYIRAYCYMQRKWAAQLPVSTCVLPITRSGWPLYKHLLRRELNLWRRGKVQRQRHLAPNELATRLGYEP